MTEQEFLKQINDMSYDEHIVYKATNQKALREIFEDFHVYESFKEVGDENYTNLYYLFLTDEFYKNDIYFIFKNWRGGGFSLFRGKKEEFLDILIDTKEYPKEQEKHEKQLNAIKLALGKYSEFLYDCGLRFNDKFELSKMRGK